MTRGTAIALGAVFGTVFGLLVGGAAGGVVGYVVGLGDCTPEIEVTEADRQIETLMREIKNLQSPSEPPSRPDAGADGGE